MEDEDIQEEAMSVKSEPWDYVPVVNSVYSLAPVQQTSPPLSPKVEVEQELDLDSNQEGEYEDYGQYKGGDGYDWLVDQGMVGIGNDEGF